MLIGEGPSLFLGQHSLVRPTLPPNFGLQRWTRRTAEICRKLDMVPDCWPAESTAEYCELLTVLRRELRAHYEQPQELPHQILTLMMALNDQGESDDGREVRT